MKRIGDYPAACQCGWKGTVDQCIPDVDGQGNLGCPECNRVINVVVSQEQPKPGPSETKDDLPDTLLGYPIKYTDDIKLEGFEIILGPFEFYGPEEDAANKS